MKEEKYPNPDEEDIMAGDRRLSRPDASVPDWEVPDTSYRPIPIVWFTGALVIQTVLLSLVLFLFLPLPFVVTALSGVITGANGAWTWRRGIGQAAQGWRIATVLMLASQLGLVLLALSVV